MGEVFEDGVKTCRKGMSQECKVTEGKGEAGRGMVKTDEVSRKVTEEDLEMCEAIREGREWMQVRKELRGRKGLSQENNEGKERKSLFRVE